jgi:hypothetical protein
MPDHYEVVLCVKGAGRKEIPSPVTYTEEEAKEQIGVIREAQREEDTWPAVDWITVRGSDIITAFMQPAEQRPPDTRSPEELLQRLAELGVPSRPSDDTEA